MSVAKKGSRVSLNKKRRLFFFQGDKGINLKPGKETAIIPEDISDDILARINVSIRMGDLSVGWPEDKKEVTTVDKDDSSVLDNGRKNIMIYIDSLMDSKKLKNSEKLKKLESLLEEEKKGKNKGSEPRSSVIKLFERYLDKLAGVSNVVEEGQEKIEISLTKGTE